MQQIEPPRVVLSIENSAEARRMRHISLALLFGMLAATTGPIIAEPWPSGAEDEPQFGPIENPSSPLPARGYQPRPCGFDLNHNGIIGEPADCNVCDASLVAG